jgi:hypothetical protein
LATNPHSAPYCGIIYFHDPKVKIDATEMTREP